jgi:hypothetical protein
MAQFARLVFEFMQERNGDLLSCRNAQLAMQSALT